MSTVLYAASPGDSLEKLQTSGITVGGAMQTASVVELQINQATTVVKTQGGGTRQISKSEVLLIMNLQMQVITRNSWPFAAS